MNQDRIKAPWGVYTIKQHDEYLRLPSLVGWSKKWAFQEMKERVEKTVGEEREAAFSSWYREIGEGCSKRDSNLCYELLQTAIWTLQIIGQ